MSDERDLKTELAEEAALRDRMSQILRDTANALHGGPLGDGYWSWHDLADLATQLREDYENALIVNSELQYDNSNLRALVEEQKTISENPNRDAAYVEHLASARAMGVTPLDFDAFKTEDRRIVTEWQRRRRGVDTAEADHAKTIKKSKIKFSSYINTTPSGYTVVYGFWRRLRLAWRMMRSGE